MIERWGWALRYVVVIILALVLAAALGEMDLFKTTKLGNSGLTAARLVRFLGYGGALLVFWLLADRAAALIPSGDQRWNIPRSILVPLATLVVIAAGQAVLLLVLEPFMNRTWHTAYNWVAIAAIIGSAAWLVAALFTGSASLAPLFKRGAKESERA